MSLVPECRERSADEFYNTRLDSTHKGIALLLGTKTEIEKTHNILQKEKVWVVELNK
jgi:hypothetical protein